MTIKNLIKSVVEFQDSFTGTTLLLSDTIKLIKVYIVNFCDKLKHVKKNLKVKIFLNFYGTYKKESWVADLYTTEWH